VIVSSFYAFLIFVCAVGRIEEEKYYLWYAKMIMRYSKSVGLCCESVQRDGVQHGEGWVGEGQSWIGQKEGIG